MDNVNKEFRDGILNRAKKALNCIDEYFEGKDIDDQKIRNAIRMVQFGVKIEHMNQIKDHNDKSLAIRLLKFLPDKDTRMEYIKLTNPEVKPLLINKPKIKPVKTVDV